MGPPTSDRGVSPIIGAVILAGFVVAAMAVYQASVVPHQNAEIEFDHHERVQDDFIHVRNAVLQAHTSGEDQFVTVEIGTTYPARLVGINPSDPSGTLRSTDPRPLVVENATGHDVTGTVCPGGRRTWALEYLPAYNEYRTAPSLITENGLVVKRAPEGAVIRVMTDQQLVRDETVNLPRVVGNYSVTGRGAVSFDVEAGPTRETSVTDPAVTVPSSLPASEWEVILEGEVDPTNVSVEDGNLTLDLSGDFTVTCSSIGISSGPGSGDTRATPTPTPTPAPTGSPVSFDQGTSSEVFAKNVSDTYCTVRGSCLRNNVMDVRFDNRGSEDRAIVAARLVASMDCTGCGPDVRVGGTPPTLEDGGPKRTLATPVPLPAGSVTDVSFNFTYANGIRYNIQDGDDFVVTLEFDDGTTSLYVIEAKDV